MLWRRDRECLVCELVNNVAFAAFCLALKTNSRH